MTGQSIIDLDIRAQFGINIIAIKRGQGDCCITRPVYEYRIWRYIDYDRTR